MAFAGNVQNIYIFEDNGYYDLASAEQAIIDKYGQNGWVELDGEQNNSGSYRWYFHYHKAVPTPKFKRWTGWAPEGATEDGFFYSEAEAKNPWINSLTPHTNAPECGDGSVNVSEGAWEFEGWSVVNAWQFQPSVGSFALAKSFGKRLDATVVVHYKHEPVIFGCITNTSNPSTTINRYESYQCLDEIHSPKNPQGEGESAEPSCFHKWDRVFVRQCYAPFSFEESSQKCVTYCPPDAPTLDYATGVCKPNPGDKKPNICPVLDPIYPNTGESFQPQTPDFVGQGIFPLEFSRTYSSYRAPEAQTPAIAIGGASWKRYEQPPYYMGVSIPGFAYTPTSLDVQPSGFKQWYHNYERSLSAFPDESKVIYEDAMGDKYYFNRVGETDDYTSDMLGDYKIEKTTDGWVYTSDTGVQETFNSNGNLIAITNSSGLTQTLAYKANDQLASVTDPAGRQLVFDYYPTGQLAYIIHPNGRQTLYEYGAAGNLVKVIHPDETLAVLEDNPTTEYFYEDTRHPYALTRQVDGNGDTFATWTFDENGKSTGSSNFGGHRAGTLTYGDNTTKITEANGHERILTFDSEGRLTSMTGGNCGQCTSSDVASYTYDAKNQLTTEVDFNGRETHYQYNSRGLQTQRIEGYGSTVAKTINTQWHSDWALPTIVTYPEKRVEYAYGAYGRIESVTEIDTTGTQEVSRVTAYSYDDSGRLSSINGPRADVDDITTYAYDANHDLLSITDAVGNITTINARNANGYPTEIEDTNGTLTTLTYDVRNRLTAHSVGGNTTLFEYDNIGQLTKVTLPNGAVTDYEYSGARLLTSMSDSDGNSIHYEYDVMGNVTKIDVKDEADTLFQTQQQVFDDLNRLTTYTDGLNNTTTFEYDAVGNLTRIENALTNETKHVYDALNRLKEAVDAKNNKTEYSYDTADNLTQVKAANDAITTYSYNGFGDLLTLSSPDTGVTQYIYDLAGNRTGQTDTKGIAVTYQFDAANRLTLIDYPGDTIDVTLTYDTGTLGKGKLAVLSDGSGSTSYGYDTLGLVASKTIEVGDKTFNVGYAYNGAGQLTKLTYPSGREVTFSYSTNGQISTISEKLGATTNTLLSSATYAPFGSAKSFTLGNSKTTTRTFNLNGLLSSLTTDDVLETTLDYSALNNLSSITHVEAIAQNQSFTFDEVERLTQAQGAYGDISYVYDSVGDRTFKTGGPNLSYQASSNKLLNTYEHDAAGNRTKDASRTYTYGGHNRLTEVTNDESGLKTTYIYNGLGQRVKKSNIFGEVYFIYDEAGLLISEADGNGNVIRDYVYFEGQPLALLVGE